MAEANNKTKINSLNGRQATNGKSVRRNVATGKFTKKFESENSMSEADKLTIRAWKKTFENQKKAA